MSQNKKVCKELKNSLEVKKSLRGKKAISSKTPLSNSDAVYMQLDVFADVLIDHYLNELYAKK